MCFSQKASFGAAAALVGIGALAFSKSRTGAQRTVALMPLIFAAQQCTEGVVWMSLLHPEYAYLKRLSMYVFLFFAEMVWPVFIPFIAWRAEGEPGRKKLIGGFVGAGIILMLMLLYGMGAYPTDVRLTDGHLMYVVQYPLVNTWYYGLIYFLPTIVGPLLSRHRLIRLLGVMLLFSYTVSRVFYNHYVISIWCYFAAVISIIGLAIIRELGEDRQKTTAYLVTK